MPNNAFIVRIITAKQPLTVKDMETIVRQGLLLGNYHFEIYNVTELIDND